jgi:hypothetical protein
MKWMAAPHGLGVTPRRTRVLAEAAPRILPTHLRVLDVGRGDVEQRVSLPGFYPFPAYLVFGRRLHLMATQREKLPGR